MMFTMNITVLKLQDVAYARSLVSANEWKK